MYYIIYVYIHITPSPKPWEPSQTSFPFNPAAATFDRFTIGFSRVRSSNDRFLEWSNLQYVFARKILDLFILGAQ